MKNTSLKLLIALSILSILAFTRVNNIQFNPDKTLKQDSAYQAYGIECISAVLTVKNIYIDFEEKTGFFDVIIYFNEAAKTNNDTPMYKKRIGFDKALFLSIFPSGWNTSLSDFRNGLENYVITLDIDQLNKFE